MALELTQLNAVTQDFFITDDKDIFFEDNILLYMLMHGEKFKEGIAQAGEIVDGGTMIRAFIEYDEANSGEYGNTTKISRQKKDIMNAVRYRWAGYYASNTIDLNERIANTGKAAIIKLAYKKLTNIQKTLRKKMGTACYASAATAVSLLGLGDMFDTTTSTAYGTVAEDDISDWAAVVLDTAAVLDFKALQEIRAAAKVGQSRNDKPNVYITTQVLKDGYERTLQAQARYKDEELSQAGFDTVLFGKVPVVADDGQTSGVCDGLNLEYLSMKTHKDFAFTEAKWESTIDQPDTFTANQRWIGQLVCTNRKASCRRTGLTAPE